RAISARCECCAILRQEHVKVGILAPQSHAGLVPEVTFRHSSPSKTALAPSFRSNSSSAQNLHRHGDFEDSLRLMEVGLIVFARRNNAFKNLRPAGHSLGYCLALSLQKRLRSKPGISQRVKQPRAG